MKPGRVCILLAGRRAGKKAIIVKQNDDGKRKRKFGHALVVGLERSPKAISKKMSETKIKRKVQHLKPFVKFVNNNHLLPTRFMVKDDSQFDFKAQITEDAWDNKEDRKKIIKDVRNKMVER